MRRSVSETALSTLLSLLLGASAAFASEKTRSSTTPALSAEQMREDLVFLRDTWTPLDGSFSAEERQTFDSIVADTLIRTSHLRWAEFSLAIAKAVASGHNGHTNVDWGRGFQPLPFKAFWFADGLYVVRADPQHRELLGARIDRLGSLMPDVALQKVTPYISGTASRVRDLSPAYLRLTEVLQHIGATSTSRRISVRFTLRDGKSRTITLAPVADDDPEGLPQSQQLIRSRSEADKPGRWPHVLDDIADLPHAFRPPVDVSSEWIDEGSRILYVRSTQILPMGDVSLYDKIGKLLFTDVLDEHQHVRPTHVIVDLRFNSGGNLLQTVLFSEALPKILPPGGKVFVLVGPGTFSAALATAAMLKGNGRDRTVLVGETMGDDPQFWAEGKGAVLPNSKLWVGSASGYHDWSNGCADTTRCYWASTAFAVSGTSLEPEVKMVPTFAQYASGHDPVLEAALDLARRAPIR